MNIGLGKDISIKELAELVKTVTGFTGDIVFDTTKPDGTPRKLMDTSRINSLGWTPKIKLEQGLESVYRDYVLHL